MIDWEDSQDGFEMLAWLVDDKRTLEKIYRNSSEDLFFESFINRTIDQMVEKSEKETLTEVWRRGLPDLLMCKMDILYWEEKEDFFQCLGCKARLSRLFATIRQAEEDDFNLALTIRHYIPKDPRP